MSEITLSPGAALEGSELICDNMWLSTGALVDSELIFENKLLIPETALEGSPLVSDNSELSTDTPEGTADIEGRSDAKTAGTLDDGVGKVSKITLGPETALEGRALSCDGTGLSTGAFVGRALVSEAKLLSPGAPLEGSPLISDTSELGADTPEGKAEIEGRGDGKTTGRLDDGKLDDGIASPGAVDTGRLEGGTADISGPPDTLVGNPPRTLLGSATVTAATR